MPSQELTKEASLSPPNVFLSLPSYWFFHQCASTPCLGLQSYFLLSTVSQFHVVLHWKGCMSDTVGMRPLLLSLCQFRACHFLTLAPLLSPPPNSPQPTNNESWYICILASYTHRWEKVEMHILHHFPKLPSRPNLIPVVPKLPSLPWFTSLMDGLYSVLAQNLLLGKPTVRQARALEKSSSEVISLNLHFIIWK